MELQGEVIEVIYKNDVNSYCIAVLKLDKNAMKSNSSNQSDQMDLLAMDEEEIDKLEEETTIVGYLPFVNIGDTLKVFGKFVEHQSYGKQFKVDSRLYILRNIYSEVLDIKGIYSFLGEYILKYSFNIA